MSGEQVREIVYKIETLRTEKSNIEKIIQILRESTGKGKLINVEDPQKNLDVWNSAGFYFGSVGMNAEAEKIYREMYHTFLEEQDRHHA